MLVIEALRKGKIAQLKRLNTRVKQQKREIVNISMVRREAWVPGPGGAGNRERAVKRD